MISDHINTQQIPENSINDSQQTDRERQCKSKCFLMTETKKRKIKLHNVQTRMITFFIHYKIWEE